MRCCLARSKRDASDSFRSMVPALGIWAPAGCVGGGANEVIVETTGDATEPIVEYNAELATDGGEPGGKYSSSELEVVVAFFREFFGFAGRPLGRLVDIMFHLLFKVTFKIILYFISVPLSLISPVVSFRFVIQF